MATTEPGISPPATTSEVGRHLRSVRKAQGLSRAEVARSAGLTRRELAAYERGRIPVPDSDLWCLAGSCGVDVSELLPSRDELKVDSDLASLTVGDSVARLRSGASSDGLLREYLAMIYELRNLPPGTRPPMREQDLAALADALGGTPEAIEARLHELIGVPRDEAARLRAMILPPLSLPAASSTPLPDLAAYAQTPFTAFDAPVAPAPAPVLAPEPPVFDFAMASTSIGDPDATDRFFAAPLVDDPFAAPPPLEPLAPMAAAAAPAPLAPLAPLEPSAPAIPAAPEPAAFDPFAPPTAAPIDPFAVSTGTRVGIDAPPAAPAMPTFDPFSPAGTPTETPIDAPTNGPDSGAFDPGTFDPATFDPGAFAAGAPAAPEVPDPFAADDLGTTEYDDGFLADLGDDPAFAIEVVALGPDEPAATMVEPVETEPVAAAATAPEESWLATWETLAEHNRMTESTYGDPFAALRVPLDAVFGAETEVDGSSDPFGPEPGFDAPVTAGAGGFVATPTETPDADADVDAFADAFEPIMETEPATMPTAAVETVADPPTAALDDEPDGEWFDRAAAATAALVADHLQAESRGENESEEPLAEAGFVTEPDPATADTEEAADENLFASRFEDADAELDEVLDEVLAAAPIAGLAPISWSLFPPAAAEAADEVAVEDADAPVDTDDATPEPDAPVVADAQFVAAGTDWQIGGIFPATAMADDGTLALRRADVRWALADLVASDDFAARATVDFTSGAGFGILFRVSVDDSERISGYSFDVDPIYGGGGFLVRQWQDNRQHWKPLVHAPVADPTRLYGHHTIEVQLRADQLTASVDGEIVLTVQQLSRCSIDSGRAPCRGTRLGVQAWSTTEVTVDRLMLATS